MAASSVPTTGSRSFGLGNVRRAGMAAIALAVMSTSASATPYVYEPFDYTAGQPLLGQTDTYVSPSRSWVLAATPVTSTTAINTSNPSANLSGPSELPPSI